LSMGAVPVMPTARVLPSILLIMLLPLLAGCSLRRFTVNRIGDAITGSSSLFAQEEDPELAKAAIPFALKSLEGLLAETPRHRGLLLAACSGFTQYSFAFVQQEADLVEGRDLTRATELRARARNLYLRGRDYGLRGLEVDLPGFGAQLRTAPEAALARAAPAQVPLLYYTAASWAAAFALDVADARLAVDQTLMEKMMHRALALDEAWEQGTIHEFLIAWEAGHASAGGSTAAAQEHYQRAMALSLGARPSTSVTLAEAVCLPAQDRAAFQRNLEAALAADPAKAPGLATVVAQRRARWLLAKMDDLFVDPEPKREKP